MLMAIVLALRIQNIAIPKLAVTPLGNMHELVPLGREMPIHVPAAIPCNHPACKNGNATFLLHTLSYNALPSSEVGLAPSALAK